MKKPIELNIPENPVCYPVISRTARTAYGVVRGIPGNNPVYTVYKGIRMSLKATVLPLLQLQPFFH